MKKNKKMLIIRTDGTEDILEDISRESIEKAIGGISELVITTSGNLMWVRDDAYLYNLPENRQATLIYNKKGRVINGDVAFLEDSAGMSSSDLQELRHARA